MHDRIIGKSGVKASTFGMGCMRLPLQAIVDGSTQNERVDEKEAIRMIHHAIDHGVTYIDTAYGYHGGNSERIVGKALRGGYRERVSLATKMPVWMVKTADDFNRLLEEQLIKLQTDHLDFYLLHSLSRKTWDNVHRLGILDFLDQAKRDGRIRHAGFSFHDQLPLFKEIVDSYAWDMCQIQFNLLDEHYQAGLEGLRYASDRGLGVVIMEPLRGGALAQKVPADIQKVWNEAATKRSPAEWAFRWLIDIPQISVILSGVSTMEQLDDNLRIFADDLPNTLLPEERALISRVQDLYRQKIKVGCTACNYCMPCPHGVNIPENFRLYNQAYLYDDLPSGKRGYKHLAEKLNDASCCEECGQCEPLCPQNILIISKLAEVRQVLGDET